MRANTSPIQIKIASPVLCMAQGLTGCGGGGSNMAISNKIIQFDCTNSPSCPSLTISSDPVYVLPNGAASPFRGLADPSLRKDPDNSRLWLS